MYIRREKLLPVMTIIRMRRGPMMGVDQNRNMEWVGSSAGLYLEQERVVLRTEVRGFNTSSWFLVLVLRG